MKIVVDIDEILASFLGSFLPYYNEITGTNFRKEDFYTYAFEDVTGESKSVIYKKCDDFFHMQEFRYLPTVVGAKEGIAELQKDHKLYIATGRPTSLTKITEEWVAENFPNTFEEIFLTNTYSKILNDKKATKSGFCLEIGADFLIEDCLGFANESADKGIDVVLLDYPWNQQTNRQNIQRVFSWEEIVNKIQDVQKV